MPQEHRPGGRNIRYVVMEPINGARLDRLLAGEPPWSPETTTRMLRADVHHEPRPELLGVPPAVDPATVGTIRTIRPLPARVCSLSD